MSDGIPESNRVDLGDLDGPAAALGGHAPGSATPFPATVPTPQPANPAPSPIAAPFPASATVDPPPDAVPPDRSQSPTTGHPALGPQFDHKEQHMLIHGVKKVTAAQANAAEGGTTRVHQTTGWQHS